VIFESPFAGEAADFPAQITLIAVPFYDGQGYPNGIFDELLAIPSVQTVKTRTYLDLIQSYPISAAANLRYAAESQRKGRSGLFNTDLTYTGWFSWKPRRPYYR